MQGCSSAFFLVSRKTSDNILKSLREFQDLLAAADKAFAEVQNRHEKEVRCGKGCDDCCHAVFDVSMVEAVKLLQHFRELEPGEQKNVLSAAQKALAAWVELIRSKTDLSVSRIRCPLLNEEGRCLCYEARPINCRTYGIPTVIGGVGHVCGLSGFEQGVSYPTVKFEQLQEILCNISVRLGGEETGRKRWPVAAVLLDPEEFVAFLEE